MTLESVPWSKFEPGISKIQIRIVAASVNFSHFIIISVNTQKIQRCAKFKSTINSECWKSTTVHNSLPLSTLQSPTLRLRRNIIPNSLLILGLPSDYFPLNLYVKISSCFVRATCSGHYFRLDINFLLPQHQNLSSPLCFESLQFMFFVSTVT